MTKLDLHPFGFQCEAEIHAAVEDTWSGGDRLVFVVGENHRDREMKRLNLLDACALCDLDIVGCAGVEDTLMGFGYLGAEGITARSKELFDEHRTDEGVIDYLNRHQPGWYGLFEFGKTLKLLRPSLEVKCVEDGELHFRMQPIANRYFMWDLAGGPHPYPDYPSMGDHPHNFLREEAMIANLLVLWNREQRQAPAALLNTGLDHSRRLAGRLRAEGISYIYLMNRQNPVTF
jgi:hypothetical protein